MSEKLKILSLFTGIGGFEVGLSISKLAPHAEVIQMVEINPFCGAILSTRFPSLDVGLARDVREFNAVANEFDVIVGGVPCQAFSVCGDRKGHSDSQNMFPEYFRIVRQILPKYCIIENVPGLLTANYDQMFSAILSTFSYLGYDSVEWGTISAASLGGVHRRNRLFICASRENNISPNSQVPGRYSLRSEEAQKGSDKTFKSSSNRTSREIRKRLNPSFVEYIMGFPLGWTIPDLDIEMECLLKPSLLKQENLHYWLHLATDTEFIPYRKERLQALGNAVVPQCAAVVWNRIYNKEFGVKNN